MGYREDAEAPTRNAIGEVLPDAATPSIIAELHESCKQRARFPRLLEYWWRSSWIRYARAAALMRDVTAASCTSSADVPLSSIFSSSVVLVFQCICVSGC